MTRNSYVNHGVHDMSQGLEIRVQFQKKDQVRPRVDDLANLG